MFKEAYLVGQVLDKQLPDTYLQQYSRWWTHAPEIRAYFMEGIVPGSVDKVSLHIRRGDYLNVKNFYVDLTETDYYQRATTCFSRDEHFLVFCKDNQGWE